MMLSAASEMVDFLRGLPHGDVWICVLVGLSAFIIGRVIVKRLLLILVVAVALSALAWWVFCTDGETATAISGEVRQVERIMR